MSAASGWIVASYGRGDCSSLLPKELFDLVVFGGRGLGELAKHSGTLW